MSLELFAGPCDNGRQTKEHWEGGGLVRSEEGVYGVMSPPYSMENMQYRAELVLFTFNLPVSMLRPIPRQFSYTIHIHAEREKKVN